MQTIQTTPSLKLPAGYAGIFEAHITVNAPGDFERGRFQRLCEILSVKFVYIELSGKANTNADKSSSQAMTASIHRGDIKEVEIELETMIKRIKKHGFQILRVKLEAALENQGVPRNSLEAITKPTQNYFEFHIKTILKKNQKPENLRALALAFDGHLSRNARMIRPDGKREFFITQRFYGTGVERARARLDEFLVGLKTCGYETPGVLKEYTIFDSNTELDRDWMEN